MSRALVRGGRPNSDPFPSDAKEIARHIGMPNDAALKIGRRRKVNVAGVRDYTYVWDMPVRGRIDPLGAVGGSGRLSGDQVDSTSTHTATFDSPQRISGNDRVEDVASGTIFIVNARRFHSDEDVTQVEVRQAT